ncbi:MAG: DUF2232 domain-containing protein [Peptostreptococcaceae bacterium]
MNNEVKLSKALIVAIALALIASYIQPLSILGLVVAVPYAIIGTIGNKKHYIVSIIVTFVVLMVSVDFMYAINISIFSVVPGFVIGILGKKNLLNDQDNKFEPIYGGTLVFVLCTIVFFFIAKNIFDINMIEEFVNIMSNTINSQLEVLKTSNPSIVEGIREEDIVNGIRNIIPTALFFQGMILAILIYCSEIFVLKRMKKTDLQLPRIRNFYLPGNAVLASFMLYMLVLFIELININLYTELIMVNLQLVFSFMFTIQGIAVCISYVSRWRTKGQSKNILFGALMLGITGFTGISFIGMLDSIIDFRKVRSYKST